LNKQIQDPAPEIARKRVRVFSRATCRCGCSHQRPQAHIVFVIVDILVRSEVAKRNMGYDEPLSAPRLFYLYVADAGVSRKSTA
jgi:hypothetical protein